MMNFTYNPLSSYFNMTNAFNQRDALRAALQSQQAQAVMNQARASALPALLQQAQTEGAQTIQGNADRLKYMIPLLSNQLNQANLRSQLLQQTLRDNPQLLNAKLALLNAQTQGANDYTYQTPAGKMFGDYAQIAKTFGQNSPQAQTMRAYLASLAGNQGAGTQTIRDSGSQFSPGSAVGAPNIPAVQSSGLAGLGGGTIPGNLQRSVGANISKRNTNNATIYDPATGKSISVPGTKTSDVLQSQVTGESQVTPLEEAIAPNIKNFMGPGHGFNRLTQKYLDPIIGLPTPDYDKYQATIKTIIPMVVERESSVLNIPKTNVGLHSIQKMYNPSPFDTPQRYLMGIAYAMAGNFSNAASAQQFLKAGIPLQRNSDGSINVNALAGYYYNKLSSELNNNMGNEPNSGSLTSNINTSPADIANNINKAVGMNVSIPSSYKGYSKDEILKAMKNRNMNFSQIKSFIDGVGG